MPITEINAHLKYRNTSGDTTVIYPITRADNIEGILPITSGGTGASDVATACANLGAAPAFTYGTDDILPGSTSEKPDGTMYFVYTAKDGIWDHVRSVFITVDGVWRLVWNTATTYTIRTNLTNVTGASSNPTTIVEGESASLIFTANSGYTLPDSVTVTGATSSWNKSTGKLTLSNPTGDVTIRIAAEKIIYTYTITTNLTDVTGASSNPTTISTDESASLIFTANSGYTLPDSVTVTGATSSWNKSTGKLTLSNPTKNVSVTVKGVVKTTNYTTQIKYYLDNSLVTTKTLTTTAYLTATNVSKDGATATVTLSSGNTSSYTYSSTLDSVTYENTSSGVINIYAVSKTIEPTTYTTNIKYYLNGSLVETKSVSSTSDYLTATNVSKDGTKATVTLSNGSTNSYTYSSTLDSVTFENSSNGVISVYAETSTYTTKFTFITDDYDEFTAFEEAAEGHSPTVQLTIYADRLEFKGETTSSTYTLPAGSTNISGLAAQPNQDSPDVGWEVGSTQTIGGEEGQNTEIGRFPVYAETSTYTTNIKYYLDNSLVTTKTVTSTSGYLTATDVRESGVTATVTLSDGSTSSYVYSTTLGSVSYANMSSGVIGIYAVSEIGLPTYTTSIVVDDVTVYESDATSPTGPVLQIVVFDNGFYVKNEAGSATLATYTYSGSGTFVGIKHTEDATLEIGTGTLKPGDSSFVGGQSANVIVELTAVSSYTTKFTFITDDYGEFTAFEEAAEGHSPTVQLTIYADRLEFKGETTSSTYTLPAGSTGISGLAAQPNQDSPDPGWEVGSTQTIGGEEGQNTEIGRFPVYSMSGSSTYTTKFTFITDDYGEFTAFEEAAEDHSPTVQMTIYADRLEFRGETTSSTYTLPAGSTGISGLAVQPNQDSPDPGWEVGSTATIGGEEGQNTEIGRFPVYADVKNITFSVGGRSYTVPEGTTWTEFVNNSGYWSSEDLTFTVSGSYIMAESADKSDAGRVIYSSLVLASATITATSYYIENAAS